MELSKLVADFQAQEAGPDILAARWYIVAAAGLAAAGAGADVPELYRMCTAGLPLEQEKLVQRRFKEAILKTSPLYGFPKSLQALYPLFDSLKDEQIDHYGPRWESLQAGADPEIRKEKARKYFETTWPPDIAQANREKNFKYMPDLYLLNQTMAYEWWVSEDAILSPVETQMCTSAALICINSPIQALWHTRAVVRHGGSLAEARFAQDLGLAVAHAYGCKTGDIAKVDDIDFSDISPP